MKLQIRKTMRIRIKGRIVIIKRLMRKGNCKTS